MKTKIQEWLAQGGCTPVEISDPEARWHLELDYPARSSNRMHIVGPKTAPHLVVIAVGTEISPEHVKAFDDLDEGDQRSLMFEFRNALNTPHTEFQMEGISSPTDLPPRFQVSSVRYGDITQDQFMFSVGATFKTFLGAVWVLQHYLDINGATGMGKFDFKRMGI